MSPNDIARIAHEANRAYCQSIGDYSHVKWESSPKHVVDSVRAGAEAIIVGSVTNPREAHIAWMAQREVDGWKYGAEKNATRKTHPAMVPWDELDGKERRKDILFFAVVKALADTLR